MQQTRLAIRWTDETGKRRGKTFTDRKTADLALQLGVTVAF